MIKNIFFDFNGTLLDDLDLCCDIEQKMMIKYNLRPYSKKEYCDKFFFPVREYYKETGFPDEEFQVIADFFNEQYYHRWFSETKLYPDVKECLINLRKLGYKIYCLSATEDVFLKNQLDCLGILDCFDGICGANNNLGMGKIAYGRLFAKEHNVKSNETIMVGDTIHDYEVSQDLGYGCILFSEGHNSINRLKTIGVPMFNNYKELINIIQNWL